MPTRAALVLVERMARVVAGARLDYGQHVVVVEPMSRVRDGPAALSARSARKPSAGRYHTSVRRCTRRAWRSAPSGLLDDVLGVPGVGDHVGVVAVVVADDLIALISKDLEQ